MGGPASVAERGEILVGLKEEGDFLAELYEVRQKGTSVGIHRIVSGLADAVEGGEILIGLKEGGGISG